MTTTTNSTLKGVLAFGALTIGAAMFFVGSEDSEGVLSETANSSDEDAGNARSDQKAGPRAEKLEGQKPPVKQADVVEWGDEALLDNTNGIDPTPESTDPFSARPTDSTINEGDLGDNPYEASESDIPEVGGRVPIASTADLPS